MKNSRGAQFVWNFHDSYVLERNLNFKPGSLQRHQDAGIVEIPGFDFVKILKYILGLSAIHFLDTNSHFCHIIFR